jgi:hypothetical protein
VVDKALDTAAALSAPCTSGPGGVVRHSSGASARMASCGTNHAPGTVPRTAGLSPETTPREEALMSTEDPVRQPATLGPYPDELSNKYDVEEPTASGWVAFAGSVLLLLATVNGVYGISAVSNSKFFTQNATYVISDLNTWGWVLIGISVAQGLIALGVLAQARGIRWFGVAIAAVNAVSQLMVMPAYPFWSLVLFALNILVIYGLIVHGARRA